MTTKFKLAGGVVKARTHQEGRNVGLFGSSSNPRYGKRGAIVTVSSFIFALGALLTSYSKEPEVHPPRGYPWYGGYNDTNAIPSTAVDNLLEKFVQVHGNVTNVASSSSSSPPPPFNAVPYLIRNGKLCMRRSKHDLLTTTYVEMHRGRIGPTEALIREALLLGQKLAPFDDRVRRGAAVTVVDDEHEENDSATTMAAAASDDDGVIPFILDFGDFNYCPQESYPKFTYAAPTNVHGWQSRPQPSNNLVSDGCAVAIPSYSLWESTNERRTSSDWDGTMKRWDAKYPWSTKRKMAVWRGSPTGPHSIPWQNLPRSNLVNCSIHHPDLIDAGFVNFVQHEGERDEMERHSKIVEFESMESFMRYRAILDIDGNSWSSRFAHLLCMNSVVLKVEPELVDYFHESELQPWKQYIPINANLSNLIESVRYVQNDDNREQVRSIIGNAQTWCRTKLTKRHLIEDMLWILISYVEALDSGDPNGRMCIIDID